MCVSCYNLCTKSSSNDIETEDRALEDVWKLLNLHDSVLFNTFDLYNKMI